MLSAVFGLVKDNLPLAFTVSFLTALGAAFWVRARWAEALKTDGRDRARLIRSLRLGGHIRRHYVFLMTRVLDRVDRLFGDAGKAAQSVRSPFGNRRRVPYWTAWSFDACVLIAIVYPIAGLFLTWVCTGDNGDIGSALGMKQDASLGARAVAFGLIAWVLFAQILTLRHEGWRSLLWSMGAVAGAVALAGAVAVAVAGAVAGAVADAGAVAVAVAKAQARNRFGIFWLAYWPVAVALLFGGLGLEAFWKVLPNAQLLLVMIVLVPLINAPFDWLSIGFTRALLRRGCERGAPSPLWLGLLDLGIGLTLMVALSCALVLTLQTVDWVTAQPGQPPLINVPNRLLKLYEAPLAGENWWIYITLFTTLIPSALNGVIGMCSLAAWVSSDRSRQRLIRKIRGLHAEDASVRGDVSMRLMAPVFIATLFACLGIWGAYTAVLFASSSLLQWFLWLAVAFEWILVVALGR